MLLSFCYELDNFLLKVSFGIITLLVTNWEPQSRCFKPNKGQKTRKCKKSDILFHLLYMLIYDIYWYLLIYVNICRYMLIYVNIWYMLIYDKVCRKSFVYFCFSWTLSESIQKFSRTLYMIYVDIWCVIYVDMLIYVDIWYMIYVDIWCVIYVDI